MKKIFATVLGLSCFILSFAQGNSPQNTQGQQAMDRIQSEKIAFFTNELDLSPKEAQKFWPVYNDYSKESRVAHDATMRAFRNLSGRPGETLPDKEVEKRLSEYMKALKKENDLSIEYYNKFKEVLPIKKVAKLYQTEEAFRMRMINYLVKPSFNAPGPQSQQQFNHQWNSRFWGGNNNASQKKEESGK